MKRSEIVIKAFDSISLMATTKHTATTGFGWGEDRLRAKRGAIMREVWGCNRDVR